ncbi:MAG: hypothetical protein JNL45_18060 [Hyphomicrobium sp.]|nr:hypothetical protein [Hyphomicrobium sp.]
MKVTRRDFVVGAVAASTMPMTAVQSLAASDGLQPPAIEIEQDLAELHALRRKARWAFVSADDIGGAIRLRREALRRLEQSLSHSARTEAERDLFREAGAFLSELEDEFIIVTWDRGAKARLAELREWAEAGGQGQWLTSKECPSIGPDDIRIPHNASLYSAVLLLRRYHNKAAAHFGVTGDARAIVEVRRTACQATGFHLGLSYDRWRSKKPYAEAAAFFWKLGSEQPQVPWERHYLERMATLMAWAEGCGQDPAYSVDEDCDQRVRAKQILGQLLPT